MLIISGPSCVGKSLTIEKLLKSFRFKTIVPYTTRSIRDNEFEGVHYNFVTDAEMTSIQANEEGFWDTPVNSNRYGYLRREISKNISENKFIIQASTNIALSIKSEFKSVTLVYFSFESQKEMIRRIEERFESKSDIKDRLGHALSEENNSFNFDYFLHSDTPHSFFEKILKIHDITKL